MNLNKMFKSISTYILSVEHFLNIYQNNSLK